MRASGWGSRRAAALLALVALAATAASASAYTSRSSATPQAKKGGDFVIGVSNTLVGNGWREEMICSVKAQALASGKVSKVIVWNQNANAQEQTSNS